MNAHNLTIDAEAVELLKRVQVHLATALDSLAGKTTETEASYLVWGASHINKTVAGYIALREARLLHASKILVRPVLEATFYARATMIEHGFWLRKAYTEMLEDARFVAKANETRKTIEKSVKVDFEKLKDMAMQVDPSYSTVEPREITAKSAAESAKVGQAYQLDFRLYCQFMHGALRATTGDLDSLTDQRDTPVMIWCGLIVCEELKKHTPAEVRDMTPFWDELRRLPDPTASAVPTNDA